MGLRMESPLMNGDGCGGILGDGAEAHFLVREAAKNHVDHTPNSQGSKGYSAGHDDKALLYVSEYHLGSHMRC